MSKKHIEFRFYEELNDFLPPEKKKTTFLYEVLGSPSVKDTIEAIGVPHVEVDMILVNGKSVDFSYLLQTDDRVSVYPIFESLDISPLIKLREYPLRKSCFILDVHLGKTSRTLRMLGFDSLYDNEFEDAEIVQIAKKENRIILTRDIGLLKRADATHGYWVRSTNSEEQVKEILKRFDLFSQITPFKHCMACNGSIQEVNKEEILHQLEPKTRKYYTEFYQCLSCKKIYWKGSHYEKMNVYLKELNG